MKITLFAIFSVNAQEDSESASSPVVPRFPIIAGSRLSRKFVDFRNMWREYGYTQQQLTSLYGYGCYCLNLGGSPMSGLGELNGSKPMDEIDRTCFHWTRCNRCAAIDYGEQCRAEDKSYNFEIDPVTKEITCKDKKNSCKWAICECDKDQVISMKQFVDQMTPDSPMLAHNGFDTEAQCQKREVSRMESASRKQCCGEFPKRLPFNENLKQCCDGKVKSHGSCI